MTIQFNLHSIAARVVWSTAIVTVSLLFIGASFMRFVITVMIDPKIEVRHETLVAASQRFPQSASIHTRLATRLIETSGVRNMRAEEIAQRATHHAFQAVQLAPWKADPWVLLAAARELTGDLEQAEKDLRTALTCAPARTALNWRLANLLLRKGQLEAALPEFRLATAVDAKLLPATLQLLWQVTNGNLDQVASIVPPNLATQLTFARFLAQQKQAAAAVDVFRRLDRKSLLNFSESKQVMDALFATKEFALADQAWQHLFGLRTGDSSLWNGGFEATTHEDFKHFDWQLSDSRYARVQATDRVSRTGYQSLRIEFLGVETTRLEQEIRQLIPVRAGLRYRLEGYAKTEALATTDGPRIVITKPDATTTIAETAGVTTGSHDWQLLAADFVAPAETSALWVTIKQTPRFTYSPPTKGTIWLDDFMVKER